MFLQRIVTASKSIFVRTAPAPEHSAEARIILQRVRELMELTPALSDASPLESNLDSASSNSSVPSVGTDRIYLEDTY